MNPDLRKMALRHPGVAEDVACKGTPIEANTFKVGKSAFLFVQPKDGATILRFKLTSSQAAAKKQGCEVGAGGWTKLVVTADAPLPKALGAWIAESYAALAGAAARPKAAKTVKKKSVKKKAKKK